MDPILSAGLKPVVTTVAKKTIDALVAKAGIAISKESNSIEPNLTKHLAEVDSWSHRIEFYGLSQALTVDEATISLDIALAPRRFVGANADREWSELDLLTAEGHYILLGDPGAGKTTTIKRICRKLLTSGNVSGKDKCQFPLVVRLRDLGGVESLYDRLADTIGFSWKYETLSEEEKNQNKKPRKLIGDIELFEALTSVFDQTCPLIALDGLDEVTSHRRHDLENEISDLASCLRNARIVLTTRSGDFGRNIAHFDILELKPLTRQQIKKIASMCLSDSVSFLNAIERFPYLDSLQRPLSLFQLIVLFRNYGKLPDQPSTIYKKLVTLFLEDWDFHNRVNRTTRYTTLPPNRKLEFLAAFAHFLLYRSGNSSFSFSESQMEYAYLSIHESFGLPKDECSKVVEEVESHTGIVRKASPDIYEFSEASQQEYLAAHYIANDPFSSNLFGLLSKHPGPIAVAIAMSNDPASWMARVFLHQENTTALGSAENKITEFLQRLRIENPHFVCSGMLGYAFLKIAITFVENDYVNRELVAAIKIKNIGDSVKRALTAYTTKQNEHDGMVTLRLIRNDKLGKEIVAPNKGCLSGLLYHELHEHA